MEYVGGDKIVPVVSEVLPSRGELRDMVRIFKLLADESRVRILLLLIGRPGLCVSDISRELGLTVSNVSHHLSMLEALGFVERERRGKRTHYRVSDECIVDVLRRTGAHVRGR